MPSPKDTPKPSDLPPGPGFYNRADIDLDLRVRIVADCLGTDHWGKVMYWSKTLGISRRSIYDLVDAGKEGLCKSLRPKRRGLAPKRKKKRVGRSRRRAKKGDDVIIL